MLVGDLLISIKLIFTNLNSFISVMCCKAMNAQCMACEKRMTVDDFCAIRGNEHIQGCERKDISISQVLTNYHTIANTKRDVAHFNSL